MLVQLGEAHGPELADNGIIVITSRMEVQESHLVFRDPRVRVLILRLHKGTDDIGKI